MHEPASPSDRQKKKPSRRRRILAGIAIVLFVLVVFHRPLLHAGLRFAAIQIAARQKLQLDLKLGGNLLTNLTIHRVSVSPKAAGPVEHIRIESMRFDYSVPMLIKHGVGEFLRSYEIRNADLAFIAKESRTEAERRQKRSIAEQLNQILAQPALYADRVLIENFNIALRSGADVTRIEQLDLFLHPSDPGWLRIRRV
ncbi:MAG: hypothetical protein M3463_13220, partial [Verrucomicrobiota bacterium]|nr:hypothetical protein [Verrucomicrobiota bacterium]